MGLFLFACPRFTYGHAGTVYKEFVYISGGHDYQIGPYRKNLLCYDYRTDVWEEKRPMITARGWHSMCTLQDNIYSIGGSDDNIETMARFDILSVESYSPQCNQWTRVAPLLQANSESGVAVWEGKIYILGGYSWEETVFSKTVQVYDREKNKWYKGTDLPKAIAGVSACVCALKPKTEDKKKKTKTKKHQDRGRWLLLDNHPWLVDSKRTLYFIISISPQFFFSLFKWGGEGIRSLRKCTVECGFWIKLICYVKTTKETNKKALLL